MKLTLPPAYFTEKTRFPLSIKAFIGFLFACLAVIESCPAKALASAAFTFQQTSQGIRGTVTTSDGKPAEFSTISIAGGASAHVNQGGTFYFKNLAPGSYSLTVSFIGQQSQTKSVTVQAGEVAVVDFALAASAQALNEVLIIGNKYTVSSRKESRYVSRLPLQNLENPQAYTVVDKELIKEQMALTLEESFRNVPGAAPAKTGAGMPAFFSRGFQTSENLRNGMATSLRTGIDLAMVERVEAIKGPSATLFGAAMTSFGGLVNYVTKKPYSSFGGEISYVQGSWDLSRLTVDVNAPLNADSTLLFRFNCAAQKENSFQDQGLGSTFVVAPSISYRVTDRLTFTLDADLQNYKGTSSTAWAIGSGVKATNFDQLALDYKRSLIDNSFIGHQSSSNVYLQAEYQLSNQWTSQTNYAWGNGGYNDLFYFNQTWMSDSTVQRAMGVFSPDKAGRKQLQQNFVGDCQIGSMRNRLVLGLDYMSQYRHMKYSYVVLDTVNVYRPAKDLRVQSVENRLAQLSTPESLNEQATYSAYFSDVLNVTERLMVMVSLRADRFINEGTRNNLTQVVSGKYSQTAFSPKVGVVYQPIKDKVALYANYMNGFKNVANAVQPDGATSVFKPQQANQWEGGVKLDLLDSKLNATISYYDILVSNSTRPEVVNNQTFTVQDGTQESRGLEIEIIGNPFPGLNIVAGYGYNENKYTKAAAALVDKRAIGTPEHVVNGWLSYTLLDGSLKGLGLGAGAIYVSEAYYNNQNTFTMPAYTVLDATLFYNRPKYRISFKANNLLDQKYWISDGFYARPQKPVHFLTSISYKF